MTTVKAYCGLARLELAQPESSRKLDLARDHIEAGLSMVKEILPNSINQVELLIVRGDIELIGENLTHAENLSTAEKTFNEALKMLGDKQHPIRPTIYANLAYIYAENNQIEKAKNFINEKCLVSFAKIYGQNDKCALPSYAFCHLLKVKIMLKSIIKPDKFALAYLNVTNAFLVQKNEKEESIALTQLKEQMKNPDSHQESLDEIKNSLEKTRDTFNKAFISLKKPEYANKRGTVMLEELGWLHWKSGQFN